MSDAGFEDEGLAEWPPIEDRFIDTLVSEGGEAYSPQTRVTLNGTIDTVLLIAELNGNEEKDPLTVRLTNLDAHSAGVRFRMETFRDDDPLSQVDFDVAPGQIKFMQLQPVDLGEVELDDATAAVLEGRRVGIEPIRVARLGETQHVGRGESAFNPEEDEVAGGTIRHASGVVVRWFRRRGREADGEEFEGELVTEVHVEEPDGESHRVVDLAHKIETEARAGGRFLIKHRTESLASAAAVLSVGAVGLAVKLGRSRLRR